MLLLRQMVVVGVAFSLALIVPAAASAAVPYTSDKDASYSIDNQRSAPTEDRNRHVMARINPKESSFTVQAYVNDHPVHMLVDTGANISVLSSADASRVGLVKGRTQYVDTLGGNEAIHLTTFSKFRLAGVEIGPIRNVGIDPARNAISILGMDILARPGIFLTIGNGLPTIKVD